MPVPSLAGPLDDLLIPFNPDRTLETILGTLQLHLAADPKVAAAQSLMEERLGSLPDEDLHAVGAVIWATYRRQLCAGARPSRWRDWLRDGDRVLWTVQVALDTFMRPSAVAEFAEAIRQLESTNSADTAELDVARSELAQFLATDIGPVKLVPFWVGYGVSAIEHYIDTHSYEDED